LGNDGEVREHTDSYYENVLAFPAGPQEELAEASDGSFPSLAWRRKVLRGGIRTPKLAAPMVAYSTHPPPHSIFSGEVEALNTPTIRRLTPSRRHQLPRITPTKRRFSEV
jgi:hypothetical protein